MAVYLHMGYPGYKTIHKPLSERREPWAEFRQIAQGEFGGLPKPDYAQIVVSSRPDSVFLVPSPDKRPDGSPGADEKRAHSLGAVNFMARQGQIIDSPLLDRYGYLPHRLGGIAVNKGAGLFGHRGDCPYVLDRAYFVVGRHDGYQEGVGAEFLFQGIQIDPAEGIHRQVDNGKPLLGQVGRGVHDAGVLDGTGDDFAPGGVFPAELIHGHEYRVVGFRSSRGEIKPRSVPGAYQGGHGSPGLFYFRPGPAPGFVQAGGVGVDIQGFDHPVPHLGP